MRLAYLLVVLLSLGICGDSNAQPPKNNAKFKVVLRLVRPVPKKVTNTTPTILTNFEMKDTFSDKEFLQKIKRLNPEHRFTKIEKRLEVTIHGEEEWKIPTAFHREPVSIKLWASDSEMGKKLTEDMILAGYLVKADRVGFQIIGISRPFLIYLNLANTITGKQTESLSIVIKKL